jgi:hypothetical protein
MGRGIKKPSYAIVRHNAKLWCLKSLTSRAENREGSCTSNAVTLCVSGAQFEPLERLGHRLA